MPMPGTPGGYGAGNTVSNMPMSELMIPGRGVKSTLPRPPAPIADKQKYRPPGGSVKPRPGK